VRSLFRLLTFLSEDLATSLDKRAKLIPHFFARCFLFWETFLKAVNVIHSRTYLGQGHAITCIRAIRPPFGKEIPGSEAENEPDHDGQMLKTDDR
jgi:hypothetical protein